MVWCVWTNRKCIIAINTWLWNSRIIKPGCLIIACDKWLEGNGFYMSKISISCGWRFLTKICNSYGWQDIRITLVKHIMYILVVEFLHGRHVSTSCRSSSGPNLRIQKILHKLTYKMKVGIPVAYNVCEVKPDNINCWICEVKPDTINHWMCVHIHTHTMCMK
jgi:hypothetical protein